MIKKHVVKAISVDKRGKIIPVIEGKVTSVLLIPSKKGAIRANHYHKKDSHWVYMISGKMRYTEMKIGRANGNKESVILRGGDMVYTKPMIGHAMEFLEDSVFLALTTKKRDQASYEHDTVRIQVV